MAKPKIMFVSAVPDFKGGAETVIRNMLRSPYIDSVLAVPEEGPLSETATRMGIPVCFYRPTALLQVHRPPRPKPIFNAVVDAFRCAFRLKALMKEHGCDIIHSHGLKPHALTAILSVFGRTRTVIHMHDIPYRADERLIWRLLARCATRTIIVSRPCYPGHKLRPFVQVIPNGIDLLLPSLEPRDPAVPLRLGFVGRFHPNKGLDLLLDWVNATRNKGINATLTLRGRQDPDMPEYWTHIQDRIAKENLSDIIKLDGWLSGADIYKDLDVILVPSHIPDPGPLVVAEAMSAGVVVAGYPAGGIPFSIENGVSGFLLRKPSDVAEALHGLVSEPGKFNQMRFAGHARVKSMFSMETFHRRTADVYHQILKQPPEKGELANTMSTGPA